MTARVERDPRFPYGPWMRTRVHHPSHATDRGRSVAAVAAILLYAATGACASTEEVAAGRGGYQDGDAGGLDGAKADAAACAPKTCAQLEAVCGSAPDGCGGKVTCGVCPAGQTCGGGGLNKCGTDSCTPKVCTQLGASCGWISDGCSEAIDCGECAPPSTCGGGGTANQCGCVAMSCAKLGVSCGNIPDGCGAMIECGACPAGQSCGGGGVANQCGAGTCAPKSCAQLGTSCGIVSDGCSNVLDCGTCTAPATCGGGGTANQCGCTPKSCVQLGMSCGIVDAGCGKILDCGTCTLGQTCGGGGVPGMCGCEADTHPDSCATSKDVATSPIALGKTVEVSGNLVPAGERDWFVASFAGEDTCSFHPRVVLVDDTKSNLVRIVVQTKCGAHIACSEGGTSTSATTWEFTYSDTCGAKKAIDPSVKASSPVTIHVGVFATGTSMGCLPYTLRFSN